MPACHIVTGMGGITVPAAPVITSPLDGATVTAGTTPVIGTGPLGSTITVYKDASLAGTQAVDGGGNFNIGVGIP
jgi:hypothetical protein